MGGGRVVEFVDRYYICTSLLPSEEGRARAGANDNGLNRDFRDFGL